MLNGLLHNSTEILVARLCTCITGIDPELGQRLGHLRILRKKNVAVIVKVTDDGHGYTPVNKFFLDERYGFGGSIIVHGNPDQLRTALVKMVNLLHGFIDICRIGIGHRLHHNGIITSNGDITYVNGLGIPSVNWRHFVLNMYFECVSENSK